MRFTVYLERLLPENVCHLMPVEQVFSDGPQQIRRWTLLSAGAASTARLHCLALAGLGRRQRGPDLTAPWDDSCAPI